MKRVAILMTVHDRREKTLRCLDGIFGASLPEGASLDVYMTDDGCTDGTPGAVASRYPSVKILKGDGNLYWNHGMRMAWEAALVVGYDFYLWMNDDVIPYPEFLEVLLRDAEVTGGRAILAGATVDEKTGGLTYGGRLLYGLQAPCTGELTEVEYFNGNIVLVPAAVCEAVGNLDPHFSHSKGDFDYGLRARKAGFKNYQCGQPLGTCPLNPGLPSWCNPAIPLPKRWKAMLRPTGMPPRETFYFDKVHYSFGSAVFHWFTVQIRCLFPSLWIKRR